MYERLTEEEIDLFIEYKTTNHFSSNGILFPVFSIYNHLFFSKNYISDSPFQVGLSITNNCNLRCLHCSRVDVLNNCNKQHMFNWRNIVNQCKSMSVSQIFLTGGEPFLHPEILDIIEEIKNNGILISILTNGTLLNEENLKFIKNKFVSRFDYIHLSMDNIYKRYDKIRVGSNFNFIINAISLLNKYSIRFHIVTVVTEKNVNDIFEIYLFCVRMKIKYLKFVSLFETHNSILKAPSDEVSIKEFSKILKHHKQNNIDMSILAEPVSLIYPFSIWIKQYYPEKSFGTDISLCPAGITSCEIDIDGNVYGCSYLNQPQFFVGNILKESFSNVWKSEKWNSLRYRINKTIECSTCVEKDQCRGGCPASAHYRFGSFNCAEKGCVLANGGQYNEGIE